jgi:hypothetical protein
MSITRRVDAGRFVSYRLTDFPALDGTADREQSNRAKHDHCHGRGERQLPALRGGQSSSSTTGPG